MSDRIEQIIVAVAPLLDGAWRYNKKASEADGWPGRFTISDDRVPGRVILGAAGGYGKAGRIEFYGRLPKYTYGSFSTKRITVAATRSPLAIAKDINRRLIPGYLKQWSEFSAQVNDFERETAEHLQKIELVRRAVTGLRGQYWVDSGRGQNRTIRNFATIPKNEECERPHKI